MPRLLSLSDDSSYTSSDDEHEENEPAEAAPPVNDAPAEASSQPAELVVFSPPPVPLLEMVG
eukprot:1150030-Prymnesium_polylepis.1